MMTTFSRLRLRIMLSLAPLLVNRAAKHSSRLKQLLEPLLERFKSPPAKILSVFTL